MIVSIDQDLSSIAYYEFFKKGEFMIIDCWIWSVTWGIYQIPLSITCAIMLFVIIEKQLLMKSIWVTAYLYMLGTLLFWGGLFLPCDYWEFYQDHSRMVLPAQLMAVLFAFVFSGIQIGVIYATKRISFKALPTNTQWVICAANLLGAILAIYFLRYVDPIIDWR